MAAKADTKAGATAGTLRIRQIKSTIGCKPNQRETVRSLGLKRIDHVVEREDNAVTRGMIAKVSHLVTIEGEGGTS